MKKLSFILILFLITIPLFANETIILDTPYDKEISITIDRSNVDNLVLTLVTVSEMYWGERFDLEATEDGLDDAIALADKLAGDLLSIKDQLKEANKTIEDMEKERPKIDIFQWGVNVIGGGVMKDDIISMSFKANPYIQLFEFLNIGAYVEYPIGIGISLGVQF